jgi:hypothetical protein
MKTISYKPLGYVLGITVLSLGMVSFVGAASNEITVCINKDGEMHLVTTGYKKDDCKKKDNLLTWNIIGPKGDTGSQGVPGSPGTDGAPGVQGPAGTSSNSPHLYDGNNQDLGLVLYFDGDVTTKTLIPQLGVTANYDMYYEKLRLNNVVIHYSQINCLGNAMIDSDSSSHVTSASLEKLFVLTGDESISRPVYRVVKNSTLSHTSWLSSNTGYGCINQSAGPSNLLTVEQVTLPFTEPLAYPLRIQ